MKAYGIKEVSEDGVCYGISHNLVHEKINHKEQTWLALHSKITALTTYQLVLLTKPVDENLLTKFHEPDSFQSVTELYKNKALLDLPQGPSDFPFTQQEWEMIPAFLENIQIFHSKSIDHAFTGQEKSMDRQDFTKTYSLFNEAVCSSKILCHFRSTETLLAELNRFESFCLTNEDPIALTIHIPGHLMAIVYDHSTRGLLLIDHDEQLRTNSEIAKHIMSQYSNLTPPDQQAPHLMCIAEVIAKKTASLTHAFAHCTSIFEDNTDIDFFFHTIYDHSNSILFGLCHNQLVLPNKDVTEEQKKKIEKHLTTRCRTRDKKTHSLLHLNTLYLEATKDQVQTYTDLLQRLVELIPEERDTNDAYYYPTLTQTIIRQISLTSQQYHQDSEEMIQLENIEVMLINKLGGMIAYNRYRFPMQKDTPRLNLKDLQLESFERKQEPD